MAIETDQISGISLLRPVGRLDSSNSADLERLLNETLAGGATKLMFDFSKLDYISSAGLRVILLAGKKLRGSAGKVVLVGMGEMVREVFAMSGFLALFQVAATPEDGAKFFS